MPKNAYTITGTEPEYIVDDYSSGFKYIPPLSTLLHTFGSISDNDTDTTPVTAERTITSKAII